MGSSLLIFREVTFKMAAWRPFWIFWFLDGKSFGSVTQVCFGFSVSNFMCIFFVAVARSLVIVSYVAFKMAALWFWTMFNCNPPIAHCYPFLWGGGILVDHWSTISSWFNPNKVQFRITYEIRVTSSEKSIIIISSITKIRRHVPRLCQIIWWIKSFTAYIKCGCLGSGWPAEGIICRMKILKFSCYHIWYENIVLGKLFHW